MCYFVSCEHICIIHSSCTSPCYSRWSVYFNVSFGVIRHNQTISILLLALKYTYRCVCMSITEAVQFEAARIVAGATKLCNINSLLGDLGWETLETRRTTHRVSKLSIKHSSISDSRSLSTTKFWKYPFRSCTDPALQLFFSTFQYTRLECSIFTYTS